MEIIVIPTVQQISQVIKDRTRAFVKRPDGTFWTVAEYIKLPSHEQIAESVCNIYAAGSDLIIEVKK